MSINEKTRAFLKFSADLLGYKKLTTAANIFCNVLIFSHWAAVTFLVREILNGLEGSPGQALRSSLPFLAGILIAALIRVAAIMCCSVLDAKRNYYYANRLRMNAIKALLGRADITPVPGRSADIFEVLDEDVEVCTFPAELFTEVTGHFIYTLIAISMLLAINWQLTLFIFIPLSLAIYGVRRLSEHMKERRRQNRIAHDHASTFISDVVDSSLAIKAAGASAAVLGRYDHVNARRKSAVLGDVAFDERISVLLNGTVCLGTAVMMFIAARLMAGGTFGIGDFSLFIAHLGTLADSVSRIVELIYEGRKAEVSYERITDAIERENLECLSRAADIDLRRAPDRVVRTVPKWRRSSLEVRNLTYSYSGEYGFSGVTFSLEPGELIVVAGGIASGKSTLLNVLMGLMPQSGGEILLNGEKVNALARGEPGRIAGAPQRGGFFADDITTNLCLDLAADAQEIQATLEIAAIDEFIYSSGEGLLKNVGDHGDQLSGGQRQRLVIARTLMRGAAINIIDDCVSALDESTRDELLRRLTAHIKDTDRSVIIATNALPFLQAADSIVLMEAGRVVRTGNYHEIVSEYPALKAVVSKT